MNVIIAGLSIAALFIKNAAVASSSTPAAAPVSPIHWATPKSLRGFRRPVERQPGPRQSQLVESDLLAEVEQQMPDVGGRQTSHRKRLAHRFGQTLSRRRRRGLRHRYVTRIPPTPKATQYRQASPIRSPRQQDTARPFPGDETARVALVKDLPFAQ